MCGQTPNVFSSSTGLPTIQMLAMSFLEAVVVGKFVGHLLAKVSKVALG
jgi:hypothetical protein